MASFLLFLMTKRNSHNKGFTLIEVIIYIGLLSLMLGLSYINMYSFIVISHSIEQDAASEAAGTLTLQTFEYQLEAGIPLQAPIVNETTKIDNLSVQKISDMIHISFSINNHDFKLSHYEP